MKYASDKPRYSFPVTYNSGLFDSLISLTYVNLIQLCCFSFTIKILQQLNICWRYVWKICREMLRRPEHAGGAVELIVPVNIFLSSMVLRSFIPVNQGFPVVPLCHSVNSRMFCMIFLFIFIYLTFLLKKFLFEAIFKVSSK